MRQTTTVSSASSLPRTGTAVVNALTDSGYAVLTNHGIEASIFESARRAAEVFYGRPRQEKLRCDIRSSFNHRGYVPLEEAGEYGDEGDVRRYESFDVGLDLPLDHPAVEQQTPLMGPNVWPVNGRLRTAAQRCFNSLQHLADLLLESMVIAMGMKPDRLRAVRRHPLSQMRLLNYHSVEPGEPNAAMGAHTDYEFLTLIRQWGGGLEVRDTSGSWISLDPSPDDLVVLAGDLLEVASAGRVRSCLHRVGPATGSRFSIVYFAGADYDAIVEPMIEQQTTPTVIDVRHQPPTRIAAGPHLLNQLRRDFPYLRHRYPDQATDPASPDDQSFTDPAVRANPGGWHSDFERRRLADD